MYTTLIDPRTLASYLNGPGWVVVDCRFTLSDPDAGRRAYRAGHIPGARYAHLEEDLSSAATPVSGRHPLPEPAALARRLGAWGVDRQCQVVVYDDSFGAIAARLWWLLRWLGHESVALLDGGLPAWQRAALALTPEVPEVIPVRYEAAARDLLWVGSAEVEERVRHRRGVVMDARAEERFRGEIEPHDPVAGHVPGAISSPFEDNLAFSGGFLPPSELRARYLALLGETVPGEVVQMCGSGVTACHNILAMEHAGLHGARLYAGSWSEWVRDARRPVARGDD